MIVYKAQSAGIAAVKPGAKFKDYHDACLVEIAKGAAELGVLPVSVEESLKAENNTIVITCKMEMEGGMVSDFHLHYRYYKTKLYCFIEEDEPIKKPDVN
jgi:hypothetical protein